MKLNLSKEAELQKHDGRERFALRCSHVFGFGGTLEAGRLYPHRFLRHVHAQRMVDVVKENVVILAPSLAGDPASTEFNYKK